MLALECAPDMSIGLCKQAPALGAQGEAHRFGRYCLQTVNNASGSGEVDCSGSGSVLFAPKVHPV
jgi:NADH pyrophosphatase NudC (nudix superfamily)